MSNNVYIVSTHTNNDEYDDQSTYTEIVGIYDNEEGARRCQVDQYLTKFSESCECFVSLSEEFSNLFGTELTYDSEIGQVISTNSVSELLQFFQTHAETIWEPEMESCDQTYLVEVERATVQSVHLTYDEQHNSLEVEPEPGFGF
jgi:hypothetical protein